MPFTRVDAIRKRISDSEWCFGSDDIWYLLGEVDRLIRALDAQEAQEGEGDGPKPDEALDPASL